MAEVQIKIGGYHYSVACAVGEEVHLEKMGELINAKAEDAHQALGSLNEVRQLLYASLLLADELTEARAGNPRAVGDAGGGPTAAESGYSESGVVEALIQLAERVERIASSLELRAE